MDEEEFNVKPWVFGTLAVVGGLFTWKKFADNRKVLKRIDRCVETIKTWQVMQQRMFDMKDDPNVTLDERNQALRDEQAFLEILLNELENES